MGSSLAIFVGLRLLLLVPDRSLEVSAGGLLDCATCGGNPGGGPGGLRTGAITAAGVGPVDAAGGCWCSDACTAAAGGML